MDVRLSAEQVALHQSTAQVVDRLGVGAVRDLDDVERTAKLDAAVEASGWRELRTPTQEGTPWASAVDVALVAEELGRGLADTAFFGPTLSAELRRLAGAPAATVRETVVLAEGLEELARADRSRVPIRSLAVDARDAVAGLVVVPQPDVARLGTVSLAGQGGGVDLTRPSLGCESAGDVPTLADQTRALDADDLDRWHGLGLSLCCADLVGVMRGALALASEYAKARRQYGATIGSFQAVQHLLADAAVAVEGSRSIALHAAWAVDAWPGRDALAAASAAKAYCARAARSVCETAIQVHGGIGNTWDCLAHLYLRRALLSSEMLGGVDASLARVLAAHGVGGADGLR